MLIIALLVLIIVLLLVVFWELRAIKQTLLHYNKLVADRTMSRQAQVRVSTSSRPRPKVEKARTTRRDTDDLPATGKQGSIRITRRKESQHDSRS